MGAAILDFVVDILSEPSILVALIALTGLLLLKKPAGEIIKGTFKTCLGFLVLTGGSTILQGALIPFGTMFQEAFNVTGVVPNNEAIVSMALTEFGTATALIMAFAMVANILIARFTPLKYVFLTGHHTLYMSCMVAVILYVSGLRGATLIAIGAIATGLIMAVFPAIVQPFMKKITGHDNVALGHFSSVGYALAGWVGKLVGKGSRSTEELNLPKNLGFLRDSSITIALTMSVLYLVVAAFCGPTFIQTELSGGQNFIVYAIIQAFTFAAGVFIILAGVRLILAEIVPAFKGFSDKLVPNSKPALDCPIVFPYAPNAVLLGFFCSFLGGIVGMAVLGWVGAVIILPGVVPHFFCGATAGVFGNATGGVRGCTIGAFCNGLLITFLPVFLLPVLGDLGFANTTFSDADFGVSGILLGNVARLGASAVVIFVIAALVIAIGSGFFTKGKQSTEKVEA